VSDKLYTVEEANALLPHLSPTLVELRASSDVALRIKEEMEQAAATNGGSSKGEKWRKKLARVQELIDRINGWEIELRDLETGLVDFPAVVDGRPAYLCWRLGEPEVAHWHSPDDGFQGRRRL
jgi:hypothetical protein